MRVLQLGPYPPPHGGVQSNLVAIRPGLYQELAKKRGKGGEIIDKRLGARVRAYIQDKSRVAKSCPSGVFALKYSLVSKYAR